MLTRTFLRLNHFPLLLLLALLLGTGAIAWQTFDHFWDAEHSQLRLDSSVTPFIARNSQAYQDMLRAQAAFGRDEVLVAALEYTDRRLLDTSFFEILEEFQQELAAAIPGPPRITSVLNAVRIQGECSGKTHFHQETLGSVCVSVLERYQQLLGCLEQSRTSLLEHTGIEDELEHSLEEELSDLPPSLEAEELELELEEDIAVDDSGTPLLQDSSAADTVAESAVPEWLCNEDGAVATPEALLNSTDTKIATVVRNIRNDPLFLRDLLSPDGRTAALVLHFPPGVRAESALVQENLSRILQTPRLFQTHQGNRSVRIAYAGPSRMAFAASMLMREDLRLILPLSLSLMLILLFLSFRNLKGVIIPATTVLLGLVWTAGAMALVGDILNLVTLACAPILICVGNGYVIKLLHQFRLTRGELAEKVNADPVHPEFDQAAWIMVLTEHEGDMKKARAAYLQVQLEPLKRDRGLLHEDIQGTVSHSVVPVSVTALTTVAGFAALAVSPIPAIQQLGIYSSVGIFAINFLTLTFAPALLHFLPLSALNLDTEAKDWISSGMNKLAGMLQRRSKQVIIVWILVAGLAVFGFPNLRVDSSSKSLPQQHPANQDLDLVQTSLAGTDTLRIVFERRDRPDLPGLQTTQTMWGLRSLQRWLENADGNDGLEDLSGVQVDKVYSPVPYLEQSRKGLSKLTDEEVERFFTILKERSGLAFLSDDGKMLQTTIRMRVSGSSAFLSLTGRLEQKIPEFLPHLRFQFTGSGVLASESANNIAKGQVQSVLLALGIVFTLLSLMFLSWKMGLIALFPNLVAVLLFFGGLGWAGISIGVTISVIAAIALGIGVDDDIHFLSHYSTAANDLRDKRAASLHTIRQVGQPMVASTITLFFGFILLGFSGMEAQALFGVLTALTLLACLFIDLSFLPAVVMETGLITVWDYLGLRIDHSLLNRIGIFRGMNVHEAKLATLMAFTQEMQDGDPLFQQGDAGSELFVILNGSVRVYLEGEQGETTLANLETGTSLGEMALFRNTPRSASAAAVGATKLLVINWESLVKLQQRYPEIAALLFLNLARTLALNLNGTYTRLIEQTHSQRQATTQTVAVEKTAGELSPKHLKVLEHYAHHMRLAVGEPLFDPKDPNKGLGLVLSGRMQVQSANLETPAVLGERRPMEFAGAGALLPSGMALVMISVASEETEVLRFRASEFYKLVKEHPHTAAHLAQHMVQQFSDVLDAANSRLQAGGG